MPYPHSNQPMVSLLAKLRMTLNSTVRATEEGTITYETVTKLFLIACIIVAVLEGANTPLHAAILQQRNEVACSSKGMAFGSSEQQDCLTQKIPGFGGYDWSGCKMIAYLTDLEKEAAARTILEPLAKRYVCGSRTSLEFTKAQYEYKDLRRWSAKAVQLLLNKIPGVISIGFPSQNRISVFAEKQATVTHVKEAIRGRKLPVDAFIITSREAEWENFASIAPVIRASKNGEQVIIPAVKWDGKQVGELVLGKSSLRNVVRMLPPWPGHGPQGPTIPRNRNRRSSWLPEELHEVLDKIRYTYNPRQISLIVGFDKEKKLIFAQYEIISGQEIRLMPEIDARVNPQEVYRDSEKRVKRGKMTSCVTVETVSKLPVEGAARLTGIAYFYTCTTNDN